MKQFADFLTLHFDAPRTRHSYYRQLGLLQKFCQCDPVSLTGERPLSRIAVKCQGPRDCLSHLPLKFDHSVLNIDHAILCANQVIGFAVTL